jgi:hypothetical protein
MKRFLAILLIIGLWPTATLADPALAVGQVWSIRATPPSSAKVIIGRIEPYGGKTAVSISVIDAPTDHGPVTIAHLPFEERALVASLGQLISTGVTPPAEFEQGYLKWKLDQGGVYVISVADVIAVLDPPPPTRPTQ